MTTLTPSQFRAKQIHDGHGDTPQWMPADFDTFEVLALVAAIEATPETCWFCSAENPPDYTRCGFCNHHVDDGPSA